MSKKRLVKNIFSVGIIQVLNYLFPLLTVPIVTRVIGPEKFGVINFASAFVSYFVLFIGYGFDLTATRKIAQDATNQENRNKVFSEVFFSQMVLLGISVIIFFFSLMYIPQLRQDKLVAIATFVICFSTVITQNWLFQAMQELHFITVLTLVSKVMFTIMILVTIHNRADYIWQPIAVSVSAFFVSILSFAWSIKRYNLRIKLVGIYHCLQTIWNEKSFFLSLVVISLYTTTNIVILGLITNSTQVGYYTAGQKLIAIFQSIITVVLSQALFPFISTAFGESKERGLEVSRKLLPLLIIGNTLLGIAFFIFGPYVLLIMYGDAFAPSIAVFKILCFTPLIISVSTVTGIHVMMNLKMDKTFLKISGIGAVFSILSNILFVSTYGSIGSAWTLFFTELFVSILFYWSLRKKGIEVFARKYFSLKSIINQISVIR